jgi:hypothetical protein
MFAPSTSGLRFALRQQGNVYQAYTVHRNIFSSTYMRHTNFTIKVAVPHRVWIPHLPFNKMFKGAGLCSKCIYHHIAGNLKTKATGFSGLSHHSFRDGLVEPENDDDGMDSHFHKDDLVNNIVKRLVITQSRKGHQEKTIHVK